MKSYKIKTEKLPKSQVEFSGSIAWEHLSPLETKVIEDLGRNLEIDGFRKGNIPENILRKHIPDQAILEEMAQQLIGRHYPNMLEDEKVDAVGRPKITITKLARGNDLEFKITTAVLPVIKLPDYKKISSEVEKFKPEEATDEEVEKTIQELRHLKLHQDKGDTHEHHGPHEHKEEDLPAVNDEFAKSFGKFENVTQLKEKIRENINKEKSAQAKDKRRGAMLDKILEKSEIEVPQILIDAELEKMLNQFAYDVSHAGVDFEDYLKKINKTKEDLIKEFTPDSEKRAKLQLLIDKIAKEEKLMAEENEVKSEAEKLMAMYPGADKLRAEAYAHLVITNEKVLSFLENI